MAVNRPIFIKPNKYIYGIKILKMGKINLILITLCFIAFNTIAFGQAGQYTTANETLKFINGKLKDYVTDGSINEANRVFVSADGQITHTHIVKTKMHLKEVTSVANIVAFKTDIEVTEASVTPGTAQLFIRCKESNKQCVQRSIRNVFRDVMDPTKVTSDKSNFAAYLGITIDLKAGPEAKQVAEALTYLIKKTKEDLDFLRDIEITKETIGGDSETKPFTSCAEKRASTGANIDKRQVSLDTKISSVFSLIKSELGLKCNYYYYNDADSHNCYANRDDNNIYLGVGFIQDCMNSNSGITGVYVVLAHEMGHLYQYNHMDFSLLGYDAQSHYGELQADFMAGCILAKLGYITSDNYEAAANSIWNLGDEGWNDPDHHGSASERNVSLYNGIYFSRTKSILEAYEMSFTYLPPQDPDKINTPVCTINFFTGEYLVVIYGGRVCSKLNGQYFVVAQMTDNLDGMGFRINFNRRGYNDLLIYTANKMVYDIKNLNMPIGKLNCN